MTTSTLPPRTRHISTTILVHGTQVFWTVVVAAIEMIVIASSAFGAFLAYSAAVYGVVFFRSDYALASIGVGALYVALCIADNQYDLLGPEWNEHSRPRGGAALALSFITLLTAGYLTNSLGGYSRGTFLAQLLATLLGQIAVRAALRQVVDRAREHGHWRRENMATLAFRHGRWRELPRAAAALVAPRVTDRIGQARAAAAVPPSWCREAELCLEPIRAAIGTEWRRAETWNRALGQET